MNSLILHTATRGLVVLLVVVSVVMLLRGHNEPGGGFIGGLVAAAAVTLALMAFGAARVHRAFPLHPRHLLGVGLALAVGSGLFAAFAGAPVMTGLWVEVPLGEAGPLKLGTPLLFDVGVFLTVVGFALTIVRTLEEEEG
jgi:multisubunit Na+/H+ antiporter MnhB subunit